MEELARRAERMEVSFFFVRYFLLNEAVSKHAWVGAARRKERYMKEVFLFGYTNGEMKEFQVITFYRSYVISE